ncbi:MAG TPA: DUF6152 family protein [Vicinamibacterales bacterium]|jgi:hypothetical protein|nr:DUF6152 family protein [Vicinamibacterales bacterium]
MRRYLISWLAAIALLACGNAYAHHSFAATYVENGSVTIEGDLVTFELRNPHSFVNVMVKDASGAMVRYLVEWGSPSQLQGKISRDTLKSGDHVIITGNPARNPDDHRLRLVTLRRPKDGWSWGLAADEVITR